MLVISVLDVVAPAIATDFHCSESCGTCPINRSGPQEVIPRVAVAPVME